MVFVTIDFETRSEAVLGGKHGVGMYKYAEDETTDVLCLAIKINNEAPVLWVPQKFKHLCSLPTITDEQVKAIMASADIVEAHNMPFERCVWREIMHNRYGFDDLPFEKLRCSAAKAALMAMPRALGKLAIALDLDEQKDDEGKRIMLKMCKPRKALLADRKAHPDWENVVFWHEDPEEFDKLCLYCLQDTNTEHAVSKALPEMTPYELQVWRLDQQINDRGIKIDVEAVRNLKSKVEFYNAMKLLRFKFLTKGKVNSPRQTAVLKDWLEERGFAVPNLQKDTIVKALDFFKDQHLAENVREVLDIKLSLGKVSVTKLDAMLRYAQKDGRARGFLMYSGAGTTRWTARGLQVHNYPRESFNEEDILKVLKQGVIELEEEYGEVMGVASQCLRGMLTGGEGMGLVGCDFSSIEARVLAWFAGEEWKVKAFREGRDMYKVAYSRLFGVPYDSVTKDQRQIGKVAELACGYQGWVNAFGAMAKGYGLTLDEGATAEVISKWRDAHPCIVAFWHGVEQSAIAAIKTGQTVRYGKLVFGITGRWLYISLPSGGCLHYCDPQIVVKKDKYERVKETIRFKGEVNGQWIREHTYGGSLVENIVQKFSRDLLADAMLRLNANGFNIVLHVHDEALSELLSGMCNEQTLKLKERIMSQVPTWAEGLPLNAEGWYGFRFRK